MKTFSTLCIHIQKVIDHIERIDSNWTGESSDQNRNVDDNDSDNDDDDENVF